MRFGPTGEQVDPFQTLPCLLVLALPVFPPKFTNKLVVILFESREKDGDDWNDSETYQQRAEIVGLYILKQTEFSNCPF